MSSLFPLLMSDPHSHSLPALPITSLLLSPSHCLSPLLSLSSRSISLSSLHLSLFPPLQSSLCCSPHHSTPTLTSTTPLPLILSTPSLRSSALFPPLPITPQLSSLSPYPLISLSLFSSPSPPSSSPSFLASSPYILSSSLSPPPYLPITPLPLPLLISLSLSSPR